MFYRLFSKKGQSTAEYAILIGVVIAAAIGIQTYVKRGIQAKFKTEVDKFVWKSGGGMSNPDLMSEDISAYQYEPNELRAKQSQEVIDETSESHRYEAGTVDRISSSMMHIGSEGDYQKYDY